MRYAEICFCFAMPSEKYLVEVLYYDLKTGKNGKVFNMYLATILKNQLKLQNILLKRLNYKTESNRLRQEFKND